MINKKGVFRVIINYYPLFKRKPDQNALAFLLKKKRIIVYEID
jgi:hypothetical protein